MYKVIIIEDDYRIAEINKSFVEQIEDFKVVGMALTGKEGINLIREKKPDLVILDVYLPDMSGQDILRYMKKNFSQIAIIMLTAAKEVKTLEFFLNHGIFDYLIKPIHAKRLHKSLQKYKLYKQKLALEIDLEQKDIDAIMDKSIVNINSEKYPKGIDPLTLERVKKIWEIENKERTAEDVATKLGISRSTARRYLDYLATKGEIIADLKYGTVGRPERIYRLDKW